MSLVDASLSVQCVGCSTFFWLPRYGGCNFLSYDVNGERLSPNDDLFSDSLLVCMECRSFLKTNKQMRGHVAMLYENNVWRMIFVLKESTEEVIAYAFDLKKFYDSSKTLRFNPRSGTCLMLYVNVYVLDRSWYSGLFSAFEMKNVATLDRFDGLLQGDLSPTYVNLVSARRDSVKATPSKRKRSRGKRGKKKCRLNSERLELLPDDWTTVYLQEHNPIGDWIGSSGATIVVPEMIPSWRNCAGELFRSITVHLINQKDVILLDKLSFDSFNSRLADISLSSRVMKVVCHCSRPLRFSIVRKEVFQNLHLDIEGLKRDVSCGVPFYWHYSNLPNEATPGIVVSMWKREESLRGLFPRCHFSEVQDRFGRAFGDRASVPCGGINCYTGPINSNRAIANPNFGKEKRSFADFDRSYYSYPSLHRTVVSRIRAATRSVLNCVRKFNDYYMDFVGYGTSSRGIWTQGVSRRSKLDFSSEGKIVKRDDLKTAPHVGIGFYNKPHYDKGDVGPLEVVSRWLKKAAEDGKNIDKVLSMHDAVGIGLPTSCGYNFSYPDGFDDIRAYFLLWGFLTPLTDCSVHHFCAWCIPHCTALPTYVSGDEIRCSNSGMESESCVFVCAFGISGGRQDAILRDK